MCRIIEPFHQRVERGARLLAALPVGVGARVDVQRRHELAGGVEVADEQQVLDQGDDRTHQGRPALGVFLDAQQVQDERQVELAQLGGRDGAEPGGQALGRVVFSCSMSIALVRVLDNSRAYSSETKGSSE